MQFDLSVLKKEEDCILRVIVYGVRKTGGPLSLYPRYTYDN